MPLYEYVCRGCGCEFEELVFGRERPACPRCKAAEAERVLSRPADHRAEAAADAVPMGCGRCGDPRGPGACSMG